MCRFASLVLTEHREHWLLRSPAPDLRWAELAGADLRGAELAGGDTPPAGWQCVEGKLERTG